MARWGELGIGVEINFAIFFIQLSYVMKFSAEEGSEDFFPTYAVQLIWTNLPKTCANLPKTKTKTKQESKNKTCY